MFSILEQEKVRERRLSLESANIVEMYLQKEFGDEFEEIYREISEKHDNLETILRVVEGEKRSYLNPTEILRDLTTIEIYTSIVIPKVESIKDEVPENTDPQTKANIESYITTYKDLLKVTEESKSFHETYFIALSVAIRKVAEEKRMTIEEVVESQELRDEVYRRVAPTRREAEEINKKIEEYKIKISEYHRSIMGLTEKLVEELPEIFQQSPEEKEEHRRKKEMFETEVSILEEINSKIKEYTTRRLDRIYGAKQ